ncbi:MAG: PAS domain S-box protein, partial [Candidatus Thorarchaeota archaeon]
FQKYLDVARVMILALDSDGTVTLVNRRGCEILGYDHNEVIGKDWFKTFLPKRLRNETYDLFRSLTKGKVGPVGYSENLVLTKDGEERIIAWYYTVLTDESGMINGTLSSGEDITERKRAEEALRQSEHRYYDLLMTLPEGVGITDLDENFTFVNKALSDMLGYTVEELTQKNVLDLTPVDNRRMIKAETERRKRNITSTYELQMIRKNGDVGFFEVSTLPQKDNQGNVIGTIGVMSNITERRQAEEALRDSESMFRSLFEQAPMGVARVGLDGAILQGNSSLALMLGYETDELVGINVFDISTPEDEETERRFSQELLQGSRDSYEMEKRFIRKDGEEIWGILSVSVVSNLSGEPIFTIGMVENITPRKKAEEALVRSEKRFRTVFEQAAVGVGVVEMDDNIIEANPFFQELIGYSADELVAMKVADFTHPDDIAIDASLTREVLDGKRDSFTMEKRYIRKTGEDIWGKLSANFVKDEEGVPEFCIGIVEDITERKKTEDKIRESEVRFRGLFEKSPIGVELYDIEGQLIDANQATLDIFGVSSVDEVKGFKLFEDPNVTDELKNRIRRGESVTYQTEFCFEKVRELNLYETSKSGTIHIDVMISPMILGGGDQTDAYIVHVRDISETRMAQDAVEKSEEQYRSLFENMLNGCAYCKILTDDQGKPIDFIYLDVNDSFEKLTGLKRNDIVGKRVTEAIPRIKEETPELFDIYGSVAQTGEPTEFEIDFSPLDIWLKITVISPRRGYFVAIFDNITERKRSEEQLRESEERLELATTGADSGIWDWNMQTGELTFNEILRETFGIETGFNPSYDDVQRRIHPDDLQRFLEIQKQAIAAKGKMLSAEFRVRTGNRDWIWVLISGRVVAWSENGEPVRAAGLTRNVTDQKTADAALESSEKRYRKLVEESLQGTAIFQDERIAFANPAYARILGRSVEELLALSQEETWALVHPDEIKVLKQR